MKFICAKCKQHQSYEAVEFFAPSTCDLCWKTICAKCKLIVESAIEMACRDCFRLVCDVCRKNRNHFHRRRVDHVVAPRTRIGLVDFLLDLHLLSFIPPLVKPCENKIFFSNFVRNTTHNKQYSIYRAANMCSESAERRRVERERVRSESVA